MEPLPFFPNDTTLVLPAAVVAVGMWATRSVVSKLLACEKRHIRSLLAECAGDIGAPDRHRRAVFQRLMRALEIVKLDPSSDSGFGPAAIRLKY